jgi:hypothetical protein
MSWESAVVLIVSTLGLVLIGYIVLTMVFRAISRPSLLLPWKRDAKIAELRAQGEELLAERLSSEDRHAVERAMNTLRIPGVRNLSGPWSNSDPIQDAERDIQGVWKRVNAEDRS